MKIFKLLTLGMALSTAIIAMEFTDTQTPKYRRTDAINTYEVDKHLHSAFRGVELTPAPVDRTREDKMIKQMYENYVTYISAFSPYKKPLPQQKLTDNKS